MENVLGLNKNKVGLQRMYQDQMNTVLRINYDFCRTKIGMKITNTNQWTSTDSICQFPVKSHDTLTYFPLLTFAKQL